MSEGCYTLVYEANKASSTSINDFKALLEKGKDEQKIDAMKKILITILNGDSMPDLLMHIIRFVMPSKNKELKKLLYFYWEVCPKLDDQGKMRHEMILVCNAIQRDLQHPNEYIRGNTLRFLCKLKQPELLETLIPNVQQCLDHRNAYVRKNAVFALFSIYQVSDHLIPDAAEMIHKFLEQETDSTCKRNAFICLGVLDRASAVDFIIHSDILSLDPLLQLAFLEFIKKDSVSNPHLIPSYGDLIAEIIESTSSSVVYEAATTLTALSSSSKSILLAGSKFIELAVKEADNNVKIITLERINDLHKKNPGVLQSLSLDILRILSCQDIDVRKKALNVTLQLISSRNVEDVVKLLKKELQRTSSLNEDKTAEYRQILINGIHQLAVKFVEVATNVIDLLLESMVDLNTTSAYEVIVLVKEVVEKFPHLRQPIISKLIEVLPLLKSGKVFRGSLWIIGEYSLEAKLVQEAWKCIREVIGEVPILASEKKHHSNGEEVANGTNGSTEKKSGPIILPDGTYATENALTVELVDSENQDQYPIRKLILESDYYLAAVLSSTLVKLVLRLQSLGTPGKILNPLRAEALLIMVSILRVGESNIVEKKIDEDSADRILSNIRYLTDEDDADLILKGFLEETKEAFESQIKRVESEKAEELAKQFQSNAEQADDSIVFRQFTSNKATSTNDEDDVKLATGSAVKREDISFKLDKVLQLTGYSDPIYAEAYIKVHQFDIVLDVLLVNQTTNTLRNLSVEFAVLGDLKVVDKPATANVGPHGFHRLQTTIKVSSADTGVIFGNIVFDGQHSDDSTIVILNDINVDIMDYIKPATCTESQFRKMWNEFEWENKITVKSDMHTLKEYLDELMKGTHMNCLTPGAIIGEECKFLSANLYSRSTFGEDGLANLCIEKASDGPIVGHVRIRSKGQGLALSLGDKVAAISRRKKGITIARV